MFATDFLGTVFTPVTMVTYVPMVTNATMVPTVTVLTRTRILFRSSLRCSEGVIGISIAWRVFDESPFHCIYTSYSPL